MGTTAFTACAGVLKREADRRELTTDTQNGNGKRFDCLLTPETSAVIRKEQASISWNCRSTGMDRPTNPEYLLHKTGIKEINHVKMIWRSTPKPEANSQSAGAGVPVGRRRLASLAAKRASIKSQLRWRRSNARKTTAVTTP
jgi:hypothetical protein